MALKKFLMIGVVAGLLVACGDDANDKSPVQVAEESSSSVDEVLSSSVNVEESSSSFESEGLSSSVENEASSSSEKSAKSSSSKDPEPAEKSSSSVKTAESSSSVKVGQSSSSEKVDESSSSSKVQESSSSVKVEESSSSDKPVESSSSEKIVESSSSENSSSSSIKESSSSVMESSSSSRKVAEIKPNNYYKVNCPEGIVCKYVITDFLNQEFLASDKYGEILDERDGQIYKTIEIGTQTWLAQNMNYDTTGFCYENVSENCEKYGKLYLKNVASKICPTGWKLPDSSEWRMLINYTKEYLNKKDAGTALKSSNGAWFSYTPEDKYCVYGQDENCISGEGTNELGFSAIPLGDKANIGENGYTTFGKEFSARAKQGSVLITYDNYFGLGITYYNYLHAIRCIKK
ncbi:MAG: hypothetical protein IK114_14575 [Fibrobacter sp.]|nr:hypothetical protein [Fibrobacter sp.]